LLLHRAQHEEDHLYYHRGTKVDAFSEEHEQHQTVLQRRRASVVTHAQMRMRSILNFKLL
jgi:hypothetical protein